MNETNYLDKLKIYANDNNIPIIEDEGLEVIQNILKTNNFKNILEIGTAIGYSALQLQKVNDSKIVTFERDVELYKLAIKNIKYVHKNDKIIVKNNDILLLTKKDIQNLGIFEMIYIDGAKAQYYNFYQKLKNNLSNDGVIVFDNLFFHGYVGNKKKKKNISKNFRQLLEKLEQSISKLKIQNDFTFEIIEKGDGIGIMKRVSNE